MERSEPLRLALLEEEPDDLLEELLALRLASSSSELRREELELDEELRLDEELVLPL